MTWINPKHKPNAWLAKVLEDLINRSNQEDVRRALIEACSVMAYSLEPGIIDQLFLIWIEEYNLLLEEDQNIDSSYCHQHLKKDQKELKV